MHTNLRMVTGAVRAAFVAGAMVLIGVANGQPLTYRVVEVPQVPEPPGTSIRYAEVLGDTAVLSYGEGWHQSVVLRSTGVEVIAPLDGLPFARVMGANSHNDFAGASIDGSGNEIGTVWLNGVPVGASQWAGRTAYASDANEHRTFGGQVVNEQGRWTAATFDVNGTATLLPVPNDSLFSAAYKLNDDGDAFGTMHTTSMGQQLVRWRDGVAEVLQAPASSQDGITTYSLFDMNASGDVTAQFYMHLGGMPETTGVYVWRDNQPILLSQGLGAYSPGIADHGGVAIIDAMGHSLLWFEGQYFTPSDFELLNFAGSATDILRLGSDGSMVARVQDAQGERIAILTLVPSPGSFVFAAAGLMSVARRSRR